MKPFLHAPALLIVLLLASLAGCRTYGGYGTEPETLEQIQQSVLRFEETLDRARGDLQAFLRQAEANPQLEPFAAQFAALVRAHEAFLEEQQALSQEAAEHPDNYRVLHRIYGTLIEEQRFVRNRYADLLRQTQEATYPAAALFGGVPPEGRYQVAPVFYERLRHSSEQLAAREVLGGGTGGLLDATSPEEALEEDENSSLE